MRKKSLIPLLVAFLSGLLILWPLAVSARTQDPPKASYAGRVGEWWKKLEEGIWDPIKGIRYSWQEGLRIDGPKKNFKLKVGGKFMVDAGKIDADDMMKSAFSGIENEKEGLVFLRLEPYVLGTMWDRLDFKFEMNLANIREIKDIWVDFGKIPYLSHLKMGHFGQPMSLEDQTSSRDTTFMERALPVMAFPPGLDPRVMASNTAFKERMTWAVGVSRIAGSFTDIGEAKDRLTDAQGTSFAGRVTYLVWDEREDSDLLNLGLSYNRQRIDVRRSDSQVRFSARPETYSTDHRLMDTGVYLAERGEMFNRELAMVAGPLSLQAEYFRTFTDAEEVGDPIFRWASSLPSEKYFHPTPNGAKPEPKKNCRSGSLRPPARGATIARFA